MLNFLFLINLAYSQPIAANSINKAVPQKIPNLLANNLTTSHNLIYSKLITTALAIFIGYLCIIILVSLVNRKISNIKVRHIVRKNIIYFFAIVIILYISFIWIKDINSIAIFLSVTGAGLALALQEVLLCIAGWFLILFRKPFEVGDRIELDGIKGDVIDIRLFQTSLLEIGNWVKADQSTGRIVNIPNSCIFKKANYNYNRGFEYIWNEIAITITFESDWKKAEQIMLKYAQQIGVGLEDIVQKKIKTMSQHYMIYYQKLTPIVYVSIEESGIMLTLRYLTDARKRRISHDKLSRAILEEFTQEENIDFAYPTYRIVR